MNLLIISQYLTLAEPGQDNLFQLASAHVEKGLLSTIITARKNGHEVKGKKDKKEKKILLENKDGVLMIYMNIPWEKELGIFKKLQAYRVYAKQVRRQGRAIPRPAVIIASSPPFTAALAAVSLSRHLGVPLLLNINGLWPEPKESKSGVAGKLISWVAARMEKKAYERADLIVAGSKSIYDKVMEKTGYKKELALIEDALQGKSKIYNSYRLLLDDLLKK